MRPTPGLKLKSGQGEGDEDDADEFPDDPIEEEEDFAAGSKLLESCGFTVKKAERVTPKRPRVNVEKEVRAPQGAKRRPPSPPHYSNSSLRSFAERNGGQK